MNTEPEIICNGILYKFTDFVNYKSEKHIRIFNEVLNKQKPELKKYFIQAAINERVYELNNCTNERIEKDKKSISDPLLYAKIQYLGTYISYMKEKLQEQLQVCENNNIDKSIISL